MNFGLARLSRPTLRRCRVLLKRSFTLFVLLTFAFTTTAQQAVGIVSTVANLVSIVEGVASGPVRQGQPVAQGAVYQAASASAAEFTFPDGLRAIEGPSSSVAFHPSPAQAGARLVALSEGLFRFELPRGGERVDLATAAGAIRVIAAQANSIVVAQVASDGRMVITAVRGRVELRDWATGALLLLLLEGHSASFGAGAANGLTVSAQSSASPDALAQNGHLQDILSGKVPPPPGPPAPPPAEPANGPKIPWLHTVLAVGGFLAVSAIAVIVAHHGHDHRPNNPDTNF